MNIFEIMEQRHSVRRYKDVAIDEKIIEILEDEIEKCNKESGLNVQLVKDEPLAFDGFMAHYGKFSGVKNYIALVGKKSKKLDELCGYYGERIVLKAQELGLSSCWVAMTYKKIPGAFKVEIGEKLCVVIAVGYGENSGVPHKSKDISSVSNASSDTPEWFNRGVEAALLAPTAMNGQKFKFLYSDGKVDVKSGVGFYTKVDLGIVKYHFDAVSGKSTI